MGVEQVGIGGLATSGVLADLVGERVGIAVGEAVLALEERHDLAVLGQAGRRDTVTLPGASPRVLYGLHLSGTKPGAACSGVNAPRWAAT